MGRYKKQFGIWFLTAMLCLTGCSKTVFTSNESTHSDVYAEAMIILTNERNRYEKVYTSQIWEVPVGTSGMNFEEYLAMQVTDFMQELEYITDLAKEQEIVLNKDEERLVSQASTEYYESLTSFDIAYMGIEKEDINRLYTKYCLANKTVNELTSNIDLEVSDSEARVCEVYQIVLEDKETADTVYAEVIAEGADFESLARKYSTSSQIRRKIARGEYSGEAEQSLFELEDGDISPIVLTNEGYCIFYSIEDYDEEATLLRKQEISEARKNTAFLTIYQSFLEEYGEKGKLALSLEEVEFSEEDQVETDQFFEIYQSCLQGT